MEFATWRLTCKVQKRLMFRGNPSRSRHSSQRFDALASASRKQSPAVVAQRLFTILMADNARKLLDIRLKTRFTLLRCMKIRPRNPLCDARIVFIENSFRVGLLQRLRLCDSVRVVLLHKSPALDTHSFCLLRIAQHTLAARLARSAAGRRHALHELPTWRA